MAGQAPPHGSREPHGRTYPEEPQRPDERLGEQRRADRPGPAAGQGVAGTGGPGPAAAAPDAGREHPLAPEQVYEQDVPHDPATAPDPAPRSEAYAAQWGPTPLPVQQPAAAPRGARTGALLIVGLLLVAVVVVLVVMAAG